MPEPPPKNAKGLWNFRAHCVKLLGLVRRRPEANNYQTLTKRAFISRKIDDNRGKRAIKKQKM